MAASAYDVLRGSLSEAGSLVSEAYAPPPPPPPGQPQTPESIDAQLAQQVALILAAGAVITAGGLVAALMAGRKIGRMLAAGLAGSAGIVLEHPPPVTGVVGAASAQTSRQNLLRRAQFVVSAGRRLAGDVQGAVSRGEDPVRAMRDGLARERRYYSQHVDAMWKRATAAGMCDMEAAAWGQLLGWYAVLDKRTSRECRAADGRNFSTGRMPAIGFPGGVHPHCRCRPGPPHQNGRMLPV